MSNTNQSPELRTQMNNRIAASNRTETDIKTRLKRIENDALQAIKCLTTARSGGKWTSYNLRAIALLFEAVVNHLRKIADEMDEER